MDGWPVGATDAVIKPISIIDFYSASKKCWMATKMFAIFSNYNNSDAMNAKQFTNHIYIYKTFPDPRPEAQDLWES